jgi:hypothetical protein
MIMNLISMSVGVSSAVVCLQAAGCFVAGLDIVELFRYESWILIAICAHGMPLLPCHGWAAHDQLVGRLAV